MCKQDEELAGLLLIHGHDGYWLDIRELWEFKNSVWGGLDYTSQNEGLQENAYLHLLGGG